MGIAEKLGVFNSLLCSDSLQDEIEDGGDDEVNDISYYDPDESNHDEGMVWACKM